MTVAELVRHGEQQLKKVDIGSARLDSELILAHVLGQSRTWILTHDDQTIDAHHDAAFHQLVARRASHEPLVHLTGTREFYGLDIAITPDVLTPRVETEQMVEWAIKLSTQSGHLIDIGTGSGAIAIAIAKHRPDLTITGTEVSAPALAVATQNVRRHNVDITLIESNLWSNINDTYDTIVTNLPYLRDDARAELMEEVKHEPDVALFGGADGLDLYRTFLAGIKKHLVVGGYLFTECDPWQHEALIAEAAKYDLEPVKQGYFILGFKRK